MKRLSTKKFNCISNNGAQPDIVFLL